MTFAILAIWFALALLLNVVGTFEARADQVPMAFGLSVVGPPILFGLLYQYSDGFRSSVLALDLKLLTAIQAWRFAGIMFLVLYFYNMLPATFAWPAARTTAAWPALSAVPETFRPGRFSATCRVTRTPPRWR